ncbi:MAG: Coenzyme F420 hydrogenase/dehydrogenase, beta subunit C-terminal domain [Lachnospiraceae bacterium]|nr:Coenzyme F420 hydrogenase/dehydrogenase, beta subunit C-terminal domain [Lachnospiraceae bacterium]
MNTDFKNVNSISKDLCTGCMACLHTCPEKCIHTDWMEGFEYPKCNEELCIKCGKCVRSCPIIQQQKLETDPEIVCAMNKCTEIRENSSSGGVFYELALHIIKQGGAVCGAGFNKSMKVIHKIVDDEENLVDLMRSKYVQSNLGNCFSEIRGLLECGRTVLFVGTPCQVNGLSSFLGKRYEGLLLIDLICHGVPSPIIWEEFVTIMEKRFGSKCCYVSFRDTSLEGWHNYGMYMEFENGKSYVDTQNNNMFMKGFLYGYYDRRSCYACNFKGLNRKSDLTLGDFWSVKRYLENFDDNKGTSLVFLNSVKGKTAFNSVRDRFDFKVLSGGDVLKYSGAYTNSEIDMENRERFYPRYLSGESTFDIISAL